MVNTYSLNKKYARDFGKQPNCEFCHRDATYWSQNGDGNKPLGVVIYHCQNHRNEARQLASLKEN